MKSLDLLGTKKMNELSHDNDEVTKADVLIATVLFFGGLLSDFREWLIDEVSEEDESGRLLALLEDCDLTPTFGAIYFSLCETGMLDAALVKLTLCEELQHTAAANQSRAFHLGFEWNDRERLDPNRDFVVALRRRFNSRFQMFRSYVISNFLDENQGLAAAFSSAKNFSQLVMVLSDLGQLGTFKAWLEEHRTWHPRTSEIVAVVLFNGIES